MSGTAALDRLGRCSAVLLAVGIGSAAAQGDRPPMLPTRDVAVTYRVVGAPAWAEETRISWLASEGRQRIEWPGGVRVTVVDHRSPGESFTMYDGVRSVFMLRAGEEPAIGTFGGPEATGRFVRVGTASYAGQTCTVWRYGVERSTGEVCIAADGAMLRGVTVLEYEGQTQAGGLEAIRVGYGPQDPARFRWPDGYRVVRRPAPPSAAGAPGR